MSKQDRLSATNRPVIRAHHVNTTQQQDTIATHVLNTTSQQEEPSSTALLDRLLLRDPLYNSHGQIIGFEIVLRARLGEMAPNDASLREGDDATLIAALYTLTEQNKTPEYPLLATIDAMSLAHKDINWLPARHILFAINVPPVPDSKLLLLIKSRLASGFRLLLNVTDNIRVPHTLKGILREARIDVSSVHCQQLENCVSQLQQQGIATILAANVHHQEMQEFCIKLKFDALQGEFCQYIPPGQTSPIAINRLGVLNLIDQLMANHELSSIESTLKTDPRLCFQMLACLPETDKKSYTIQNVGQAISLHQRDGLYRWLTMLLKIATESSASVRQIQRRGLQRAHFMEIVASNNLQNISPQTAWLVGLLSVCDALLKRPLTECLDLLPLDKTIKLALLQHSTAAGMLLKLAIATEKSDPVAVETLAAQCLVNMETVHIATIQSLVSAEHAIF